MPRIFVHFTFLFFTITALSGVWMRYNPFNSSTSIPYTNMLHAHSHLALLGWLFFGAFIIFLSLYWNQLTSKKQASYICIALFIISLIMFIAFVYQGYAVFSIIMSTLHIFVEYWAAIFMYRQLKKQPKHQGKIYIYSSLIVLVISSIGPYALGVISANGWKESAIFDMAIYFYLHFQYNGWLYLFLVGLFLIIIKRKNILLKTSLLSYSFWIYFISLFPGYFTNIQWADLGILVEILAGIGSIGQWVAILLLLLAIKPVWKEFMIHFSKLTITALGITFTLLFLKSSMELGLIIPDLANLVYDTRSVIIGYLHLTLLGFISIFVITQYFMTNILSSSQITGIAFSIFISGFILNEALLFLQTLMDWFNLSMIPFYFEGLLVASAILLLGILLLWFSYHDSKID